MSNLFNVEFNNVGYLLEDGRKLFGPLTFGLGPQKIGLVGRNGSGKTTLVRLMNKEILPSSGSIIHQGRIAYLAQNFKFESNDTIAEMFKVRDTLEALRRVYAGGEESKDLDIIGDNWDVEPRIQSSLGQLGLGQLSLERKLSSLSGGEITRLMLAGILLDDPDVLILDEPTNNLDKKAREALYVFIKEWRRGLMVISHDRKLLNYVDEIWDLSSLGLNVYGGNYSFYKAKKVEERAAANEELERASKELKRTERFVQKKKEIKQRKDSQGKKKRLSGNQTKLFYDSLQGRAEKTQAKLSLQYEKQLEEANRIKKEALVNVEQVDSLALDLSNTKIPSGKQVLFIEDVVFAYPGASKTIIQGVSMHITGPERVGLQGNNGSGKTTLLKLIQGFLDPDSGEIKQGVSRVACLDQKVECLDTEKTILDNFKIFNPDLNETECRHALARFLFPNREALKRVDDLSGGERLRAGLACLLMAKDPPQLLILDEPTNHLDLDSIKSIEQALRQYGGALLVVSHDEDFLRAIGVDRYVAL